MPWLPDLITNDLAGLFIGSFIQVTGIQRATNFAGCSRVSKCYVHHLVTECGVLEVI